MIRAFYFYLKMGRMSWAVEVWLPLIWRLNMSVLAQSLLFNVCHEEWHEIISVILLDFSFVVVAVVVAVAILGVHLGMLISCNLYEVVPVHDRPHFKFKAILLLNLFVGRRDYALVLHLLAGPLCAVVQKAKAGLLGLVLANLVLLNRTLFLFADPAYVELFGFYLPTFLHFLLVC